MLKGTYLYRIPEDPILSATVFGKPGIQNMHYRLPLHVMVNDAPVDPACPTRNPLDAIPAGMTGFVGKAPIVPKIGSVWGILLPGPHSLFVRRIIITYPVTEIFRQDRTGGEFRTVNHFYRWTLIGDSRLPE